MLLPPFICFSQIFNLRFPEQLISIDNTRLLFNFLIAFDSSCGPGDEMSYRRYPKS
jgi:hypothetical protein